MHDLPWETFNDVEDEHVPTVECEIDDRDTENQTDFQYTSRSRSNDAT